MSFYYKQTSLCAVMIATLAIGACSQGQASDGVKIKAEAVQAKAIATVEGALKKPTLLTKMAAVAVSVSDLEASKQFYQSVLGMVIIREVQTEDYDEAIMGIEGDTGAKIVLFQSHSKNDPVSARIVFYTQNAEQIMQKFKEAGLEIVHEFAPIAPGVPVKIGIAKDADGNTLEFIQRG